MAAGVAGLLSLGIQITEALFKFYTSYKDQDTNVARTTRKLKNLLETFRSLETVVQSRKFRTDERDLIDNIESSIQQCEELIQELQDELDKLQESSAGSFTRAVKAARRRAAYPFRQSTLQKLDEDVGEIRDNLGLVLEVLQLRDHKATQDDIEEVRSLLEVVRATQVSDAIRNWLKAPDATVNHNTACAKRHPGTGMWLVKGPTFRSWLTQGNSFLWLNGFAGCGKSVLCSTAIQHAFRQKNSAQNIGVAFFYFTFSNESKQDESAILRALLLQLAGQISDGPILLGQLHSSYQTGTPSPAGLIEYLRLLMQKFDQVYILVDALDESPRYKQRDRVLGALRTMRQWKLASLHLLVTSRDEPDIRRSLNPSEDEDVLMQNMSIDKDIGDFISGHLDTELPQWHKYHDQIQKELAGRARGVYVSLVALIDFSLMEHRFRWVECQFAALRRCPRSERHLNRCLQTLPRDLDETYERMLCGIDDDSAEEARRILTLLCFSVRPLSVSELINALAVRLDGPVGLDRECRLEDADSILEICPGLIVLEYGWLRRLTFQIAHFSVQEYLESDRIKQTKAAFFALSRTSAHRDIAQLCCVYLLDPELAELQLDARRKQFPFAGHAANCWVDYYGNCMEKEPHLNAFALKLFTEQATFRARVELFDAEDSGSPVCTASLLGLEWVLQQLLATERGSPGETRSLVNAPGGRFGNALQAASTQGFESIVRLLLAAGADVNGQGGIYGNALQAALVTGSEATVRLLLTAGADVNARCASFEHSLIAASAYGQEKVVQLLLDAGANINCRSINYGTALEAASSGGFEAVVRLLLAAGADVNTRDEDHRNALYAAVTSGDEKVVQVLLDAGADINCQDTYYGNLLQKAIIKGHRNLVPVLLDSGANAKGGDLQVASYLGKEQVVQMLLDAGTDVNAHWGKENYGWTALQLAIDGKIRAVRGTHEKVVQMLLDAGADANAQARQTASKYGQEKIVQSLLHEGADVNAPWEGGGDCTAKGIKAWS